jgi:hypothetical protein
MASENQDETSIQNLPTEIKILILQDLSEDDLIKQTQIPGLRYIVIELLKKRLDNLSIRNLVRLYKFRDLRVAVGQYYTQCLLSLKYNKIKDIYQNETDPMVRTAIEARIAEVFVELSENPVPENFNVIKQIDTIRAILFTNKFMEIVEENGGTFNAFAVIAGQEQRNMISGIINMRNIGAEHSYSLEINVGLSPNMCRLLRGQSVEGDINCEYNDIFQRLFNSINSNYTLDDIKIYTQSIGNNIIGSRINVYNE